MTDRDDSCGIDGLHRQRLFGLDLVDSPALDAVVAAILDTKAPELRDPADGPVAEVVVTPNVDIVVSLDGAAPPEVESLYRRARYVLPDGMPVVAASRWLGRPLASRLTGSGLFAELWPRVAAEQRRVAVLCSNESIAEDLGAEHATAEFVVPPFFDVADATHHAVIAKELFAAVDRSSAEFVFLGLGHPKDALITTGLLALCAEAGRPAPLCLCLGGSFAMYVGQQRRAPMLVQRIGMEWFYRFAQEPRRLFRRYFVDDLAFFGIVWRERTQLRRRGPA
jgi:N-acetylglucosaminyldiphosphoundecaprenol N-acetyl-beta-D-mannosaminyltransferase